MAEQTHKRALWVTTSFPRFEGDGNAPFLLDMARGLVEEGWEIHVLAPHAFSLSREECIGTVVVKRFRYFWPESLQGLFYGGGALGALSGHPYKILLLPFFAISLLYFLHKTLKFAKKSGDPYTLVHSHWLIPTGLLTGLVAQHHKCEHVVTCHGSDLMKLKSGIFHRMKRWGMKLARRVHVNSPAMSDLAVDIAPFVKAVTIPLGVQVPLDVKTEEAQQFLQNKQFQKVAFVGRLSREKGADIFLEVFCLLQKRLADIQAIIVGDGPESDILKERAKELGVLESVTFTGQLPVGDARAIIGAADVLVIPSRSEGFGMVSVEALILETPVVAASVGGLPYALDNGKAGVLISGGRVEAYVEALEEILLGRNSTKTMVEYGKRYALENFESSKVSQKLASLYKEAIEAPQK